MCWHKWFKWATYTQPIKRIIKGKIYNGEEKRQSRSCDKCGKSQDELVD